MAAQITIVGLGSGDESQLSLGVWRKLQCHKPLYLRTAMHPVVPFIQQNGITYETFDAIYEQYDNFSDVYDAIVSQLITAAQIEDSEIVYAVPGHPMVAERTSQLLLSNCVQAGVELRFLGGESFVDQAFLRFGFDPIEGFQLIDGSQPFSDVLNPRLHALIAQVYDHFTASDVKLSLMEIYPDEYPIVVGHSLGVSGAEQIHKLPLYELDRIKGFGNLSLVWVPRNESGKEFYE